MNKKNGLSKYRQRKLVFLFCADLTATQAAIVGGVNRNTVNRYYRIFREAIRDHQRDLQEQFVGTVEVDESYFGATRRRGDPGSRKRGRGSGKQPVFGVFERAGGVFAEVDVGLRRVGVQGVDAALRLAGAVAEADGVDYRGILFYAGHIRGAGRARCIS